MKSPLDYEAFFALFGVTVSRDRYPHGLTETSGKCKGVHSRSAVRVFRRFNQRYRFSSVRPEGTRRTYFLETRRLFVCRSEFDVYATVHTDSVVVEVQRKLDRK